MPKTSEKKRDPTWTLVEREFDLAFLRGHLKLFDADLVSHYRRQLGQDHPLTTLVAEMARWAVNGEQMVNEMYGLAERAHNTYRALAPIGSPSPTVLPEDDLLDHLDFPRGGVMFT